MSEGKPMRPNALSKWTGEVPEFRLDELAVRPSDQRAVKSFVSEYHYAGGMGNAAIPVGLYHKPSSSMVGAIAFHTPISENTRDSVFGTGVCDCELVEPKQCNRDDCDMEESHHHRGEHVTELHRMAIHPDAPKNTATWFISRALKTLKERKPHYTAVVSFADTTEGHDGTVYQAANADYYGMSGKTTYYRDDDGVLRSPRQCGENITTVMAESRGWVAEQRESKHRYVFWLPNPYQSKKDLKSQSELNFEAYP